MKHNSNCAVHDPVPGPCDCKRGKLTIETDRFLKLWVNASKYAKNYDNSAWESVKNQLESMGVIDIKGSWK